ncbi:HNH endonuclease signature motif containing protein [Arthrobacter sp. AQ5-05]|uniref:HNH endonuclease signature motif containing protein n=1 Tax=Arthrobacter sp. AQ5-05 TaxID=2184581 RepID=UPI0015EC2B82|nr:HNH endonuclease signature motif containing protein [Arthrobacter sp. AQ5-05]
MNTEQFAQILGQGRGHTGRGSMPGHAVARANRLRVLLAAEEFFVATATELATGSTSPTEAAMVALIVERAHRRTSYAQILAAQSAQRTLAHELPIETMEQLSATVAEPGPFLAGMSSLPTDPPTAPTGRMPHKDTADFLQHLLGTAYFEVRDRINAATALAPHVDVNGVSRPARYPRLSEDAQSGTVDPRHAIQVAKKMDKVALVIKRQPEAEKLSTTLEDQVLDSLRTQGPQATGKLVTSWQRSLEKTAPSEPSDEEIDAKTGIFLTRRTEHFSYFSMCVLNSQAEIFLSHFAHADNARTTAGNREDLARDAAARTQAPARRDGGELEMDDAPPIPAWAITPETAAEALPRAAYTDLGLSANKANSYPGLATRDPGIPTAAPTSHWQEDEDSRLDGLAPARRRLQSILNALQSVGGSAKGGRGLARATLVVYCRLETLLGLAEQAGISAHGLDISPGELRRMLCDSGVLPIVFSGESQILDLGREQRFVPDYMREGILARDGGCLVPGCSVPPEHCEMCHIDSWEDGGVTSVENTGPGCSAHHHDFHSGKIRLVRDGDGLPAVLLPKYLDPEQIPRRNDYWQHRRQTNPKLF